MRSDSNFSKNPTICVLGLGYVGLPLAVEFGKVYKTVGFDINEHRVQQLNQLIDVTLELDENLLDENLNDTIKVEVVIYDQF